MSAVSTETMVVGPARVVRLVARAWDFLTSQVRRFAGWTPLGRTTVGTVALHVVAEGLRMKVALIFLVLMAITVLALPFSIEGDGSLTGAVQSYLSFSLSFSGFFLSILTVFLARTISDELVHRQSFMLFSKPLARWQYILGKWLGIALFDVVFLAFSFVCIYGMMHYIIRTKKPIEDNYQPGLTPTSKLDLEQLARKRAIIETPDAPTQSPDRHRLEAEVLVARHATMFELPDFSKPAEAEYNERVQQGFYNNLTMPVEKDKELARLREKYEAQWRIVQPLDQRTFSFSNILCDRSPGNSIQLRYKTEVLDYAPDEVFRSAWQVGDPDKGAKPYLLFPRHIVGRFQSLKVPADCVGKDGTLTVQLQNINPYANPEWFENPEPMFNNTLEITRDGVKCLFVVGSFEGNLLRLYVLMLCKLLFLGAVAVLMASQFSFPVATLASFAVYTLAGLRAFMIEALDQLNPTASPIWTLVRNCFGPMFSGELSKASEAFQPLAIGVLDGVLHALFKVIPDFSYFDGVETLVNGENVSLVWMLQGIGELVLLQAGIMLGLAIILFYRREVAETSV